MEGKGKKYIYTRKYLHTFTFFLIQRLGVYKQSCSFKKSPRASIYQARQCIRQLSTPCPPLCFFFFLLPNKEEKKTPKESTAVSTFFYTLGHPKGQQQPGCVSIDFCRESDLTRKIDLFIFDQTGKSQFSPRQVGRRKRLEKTQCMTKKRFRLFTMASIDLFRYFRLFVYKSFS